MFDNNIGTHCFASDLLASLSLIPITWPDQLGFLTFSNLFMSLIKSAYIMTSRTGLANDPEDVSPPKLSRVD
jgi:hypothetical protein